MNDSKTKIYSVFIIALAISFSAYLLSNSWLKSHHPNNVVSVTGLAQKDFISDLIVWRANFSRFSKNLIEANQLLGKDLNTIKDFLLKSGLKESEFKFTTIQVNREYKTIYNNEGNVSGQEFSGYTIFQSIIIESKRINEVENIISKINEIINYGIELNANSPDYFYTKLGDLKIELLEMATKDAYHRAETITKNANSNLGNLKKASMGVFQITAQNTNEEFEWGGSFNTKSKNKSASITVRLEYEL